MAATVPVEAKRVFFRVMVFRFWWHEIHEAVARDRPLDAVWRGLEVSRDNVWDLTINYIVRNGECQRRRDEVKSSIFCFLGSGKG